MSFLKSANFNVETEVFRGPLELLLELIEKRKLLINDVSLASVADSFMDFVKSKTKIPIGDTAQFLVVASTLLLIKSRSLLPNMELSDDEQHDIETLKKRLELYKNIKDASTNLASLKNLSLLAPKKSQPAPILTICPTDLSQANLHNCLIDVINDFPQFTSRPDVEIESRISLPEMIDNLKLKIKQTMQTHFSKIAKTETKHELIVSFLALLELVRQEEIDVEQEKHFSDIKINSLKLDTPVY